MTLGEGVSAVGAAVMAGTLSVYQCDFDVFMKKSLLVGELEESGYGRRAAGTSRKCYRSGSEQERGEDSVAGKMYTIIGVINANAR